MVYARTLAGRTYTFQVSGKLWRNSLIMQDRETGSSWSHITGDGLAGRARGTRLVKVPSVQTTWESWRAEHPDTRVLRKSEEIRSSRYAAYFEDPDRLGLFRSRWLTGTMAGKAMVYGATIGPHAVAATDAAIDDVGLVAVELGGTPVVIVRGDDRGVRGFVARAAGRVVGFRRDGAGWRDHETGSVWDLVSGRCVSGELSGQSLESVAVTPAFWFAWSSFYPNTKVILE